MKFMRVKSLLEVPYDINTYHGYHGEEQFYYSVRLWCDLIVIHQLDIYLLWNMEQIEID